jgi:hypothetical protein
MGKEKTVDRVDLKGKPVKKVQFVVVRPNDPTRKEFELKCV